MSKKGNRLVVADGGWGETIPSWLKDEVVTERLLNPDKVGDAEVCLYLYTATFKAPMEYNMGGVYVYLSSKIMKRKGIELPLEVEDKLNPDQERDLDQLRRDIYKARGGKILIIG